MSSDVIVEERELRFTRPEVLRDSEAEEDVEARSSEARGVGVVREGGGRRGWRGGSPEKRDSTASQIPPPITFTRFTNTPPRVLAGRLSSSD
jgi:hypothetical protein